MTTEIHVPTRRECEAMDARDPLSPLRGLFVLPPGIVYLDGNSLGPLPKSTSARVADVIEREWGQGLIASWNAAGWIDQPRRVGDKIATLIGAGAGEVVTADSTSVNVYKTLSVALALVKADAPHRRVVLSERDNFPTDLYIAQSLCRQHGFELRLVETDALPSQFDRDLAVLMLTHANYRTGRRHDLAGTTAAVHAAGGLVLWDLAHSAGAMPVRLAGGDRPAEDADFAVGCGYKYLNGGPGAPAFLWAHPRHAARMDREGIWQPLSGWLGHRAPFMFTPEYTPAAGIERFVCGTPSPIALAALECGVDSVLAANAFGGLAALREKSIALTDLFIALVEKRCAGHGLVLQTPRDREARGSQVSFFRPEGAYAIVQALIARGVIGDYRDPGILRFGFAPMYLRFVDAWDAVDHLAQVLESGEWKGEGFATRAAVT
jgi:kynureninase